MSSVQQLCAIKGQKWANLDFPSLMCIKTPHQLPLLASLSDIIVTHVAEFTPLAQYDVSDVDVRHTLTTDFYCNCKFPFAQLTPLSLQLLYPAARLASHLTVKIGRT